MTDLSEHKDRRTASERIADYEKSVAAIERNVAMRYARGNVLLQLGQFITEDDLVELNKRAEENLAHLRAAFIRK